MNCPNCQAENQAAARFCAQCGAALAQACAHCGATLQPGARFCHQCGQPVAATAPAAPLGSPPGRVPEDILQRYIPKELLARLEAAQRSHLMVGERRVVTILFCDVKGSSLAASRMDPEEWAEIMNGAFTHMIRPVYRYEGTVARLQGDGLLAFFGAPIAHEDDPQRAVLAGQQIVEAVHTYGQEVRQRWGIDFEVRVGINTGLVVVGEVGSDLRVEYSALGDAINMAARMEQTAEPGNVQVAEATYKLVAPLFDFEAIGNLEVKGRETPLTAYRVLGRKTEPGSLRGLPGLSAPLIGRQAEMESLQAALGQLLLGNGGILAIIGEAGLGKSRLVAEFRRAVLAEAVPGLHWLEGRSLSYEASTPFAPFLFLFKRFFELPSGRGEREIFACIQNRLETLFPGRGEEIAPFFATLLGIALEPEAFERVRYLEPPALRSQIFTHVGGLIERLLAAGPVILNLDDLHWMDPTSLELLQSLLPLARRAPLLVILAFRPARPEEGIDLDYIAGREVPQNYQPIHLRPLEEGESRALVGSLLTIEDLPESVRQKILEKSEGNPFYIEEIIRSLLDGGFIVRENGTWRATRAIQSIALPGTLAGVITSRLDRLDETTRHIVQAASVIGREFTVELLTRVVETPTGLPASLEILLRREIIREKGPRQYSFKHALTQETAYQSILLSNRRELHRRSAEAWIALGADSPGEIARHLLEARLPGRALPYLVQAGDRAARSYATPEAIGYYRQALEIRSAAGDPELLRQAFEGLGNALSFANQIPAAQAVYQEMLSEAEASGNLPMQISALNKLGGITALRLGRFTEAEVFLARSEKLSREYEEKSGVPEMSLIRCQMCTARGDFEGVIQHMDEVVQIGQETGSREHLMLGLEHISTSLVYLARFAEAQEKALEALALAREVGNQEEEAWLLGLALALCALSRGDIEEARASLDEGLQIASKIGSLLPQITSAYLLGEIARWQGDYERALSFGYRSLEAASPLEAHMPFMVVPPLGSLGMTYLEISEEFREKIGEFHLHALRLLEHPAGAAAGGTAWADLGLCALSLGDEKVAEAMIEKGLNHPNMFMRLERPRHLAGAALLASARGEHDRACQLAVEARSYAEERRIRYHLPFTSLILGRVLAVKGEHGRALDALERAESEALALGMRPIALQARHIAAGAWAVGGEPRRADQQRAAAQEMASEIAGSFNDENLRQAYLQNLKRKRVLPFLQDDQPEDYTIHD